MDVSVIVALRSGEHIEVVRAGKILDISDILLTQLDSRVRWVQTETHTKPIRVRKKTMQQYISRNKKQAQRKRLEPLWRNESRR